MGFAKEITDKCLKDEYWKELSQKVLDNVDTLTKKEFNDIERFIDLLTITKHKEANEIAYHILQKLNKYSSDERLFKSFELSIKASLSRYENFDIKFTSEELELIPLDRRVQINNKEKYTYIM